MVSFVFLGAHAFVCCLGCDITQIVFDFCVQSNVEASGAAEDEVLAPGGVEAGAVSIEPLVAGRMVSHQHRLLIFSFSSSSPGLHIHLLIVGRGASGSAF